jgi:hypothetical protein
MPNTRPAPDRTVETRLPRRPRDADGYVRARDLPKLVPLWPGELRTLNGAAHARLVSKLRRALRAERQRGLAGHWAYDLTRHAQLLRAYRAETAAALHDARGARSRTHTQQL